MIRHEQIGIFILNPKITKFIQIKKSTELTISMNPDVEEKEYIADKNASKELKAYAPQIDQPLTMLENEEDFKYFFDLFFKQAPGEDAKTKCLIVFKFQGNPTDGYKAWQTDCLIEFNEMNTYDSNLEFSIDFAGDTEKGVVKMVDGEPTFAGGEADVQINL